MPIVEVKIANNVLILPCNTSDNVGTIAAAAFREYEASFQPPPSRITVIRDAKQRILSTSVNIFEAGLETYLEVVLEQSTPSDIVKESELLASYEKWQLHFVRQCFTVIQASADLDSLSTPSPDILQLLSELKYAQSEAVVSIVLNCFQLLLRNFRSTAAHTTISKELMTIFLSTPVPSIAVHCLQLMKHTKQAHPSDLLQDVLAKISYFGSSVSTSPTPQASLLQAFEEYKFQYEASKPAISVPASISPPSLAAPSAASSGMSLSRIVELLKSNDNRCRKFALEKLSPTESSDYISTLPATISPGATRDLMEALCICLKQSLTTPTTVKPRKDEPVAACICSIALQSETSDIVSVTACLQLIQRLLSAFPHTSSTVQGRAKLLYTLLHASDVNIATSCATILQHCVTEYSWADLDIDIDSQSLYYLLQRSSVIKFFVLHYVKYLVQVNSDALETLLCSDNYAILQSLWKMLSASSDISEVSLAIFATISVHNYVRSFIFKFGGIDKVVILYYDSSSSIMFHSCCKFSLMPCLNTQQAAILRAVLVGFSIL